jgi:nucleotide-binding universal stress UspA family protein
MELLTGWEGTRQEGPHRTASMAAPQYARITVATDGSAFGQLAVDSAIDLAKKYGSQLVILSVAPLVPSYVAAADAWVPTGIPTSEIEHYRGVVGAALKRAEEAGLTGVTGVLLEGVVSDEIIAHVEHHPTDLLVLGSRGLSTAKRLLLGSVSDAVLHHLKVPALVVRGPAPSDGA